MSSSVNSVVCEEIFDESSHPSNDEIRDYAAKLGIDPENEPQLLPIAAEGLMRALPPGWRPCLDEKKKSYYYYNNITGKTQWEHPLDDLYRGLVAKKRTESQSLSLGEPNEDATYTRDDLPSYEEPPIFAKSLEPLSLGARKKELKTSPLKSKTMDFHKPKHTDFKVDISPKMIRQKSEERPIVAFTGNRKVGLSMSSSFDLKTDLEKKDFRLSGGGSMFLKTNTKKTEDNEISEIKSVENKNEPATRGILRERSFVESVKSIEEEDRKVRFNLDDNPAITLDFELSDDDLKTPQEMPKTGFKEQPTKIILPQEILKLIKPNPKDIMKSKDNEMSAQISDSEDESIMKSYDKNDKKLEFKLMMKHDLIAEKEDAVAEEMERYKTDNSVIIKEFKHNADKELANMKKTIWEEKNDEINKYRQELQSSHKNELERILSTEKNKYEENIKYELSNLRLEMESRNIGALEAEKLKLESELGKLKERLQMKYKIEEEKLDQIILDSFERKKEKLQKMYEEKLEDLEKDLGRNMEKHKDELIVTHNAILDQLKQNQQSILDEIRKDFKSEEKIIRREHESQISDLKKKVNLNIDNEINNSSHGNASKDTAEDLHFEKVRCEKRLLEDKYRCLKDKYLRLKTDVKLSIEKRNRKREQSVTTTTGSETERSNSINKERSPHRSPSHLKTSEKPPIQQKHDLNSNRQKSELKPTRTILIHTDLDTSTSDRSCTKEEKFLNYDSSDNNPNPGRSRKKLFSRIKSSSTSRVNNNKSRKTQRSCSPVENLRRQLQKLEDLEDQFPQNPQSDTYHLRYPFSDGQKFEGSSELEFFRHRIHLERDSIKRAKESLRTQKCLFQQRQNDLKLKHGSMARHTLQQLCQEEKDLTDMEVSLHRTRSLLGEKVIRLRHLEQSLQRATAVSDPKQEDATLSDLSSHSASSGISSTEFATAADGMKAILRGEHLEESSEIIQSLENLNSEIREIWEVLNQQQVAGNIASVMPLPLVYPDLGWPLLGGSASLPAPPSIPTLADRLHNYRQHVALSNAQSTVVTHAANQGATTTLVERTRNLRHWLRQAGIDAGPDGAPPQATL